MPQVKNPKDRQIGKKPPAKKHIIDPRYKNTFWTGIFVVVLIIFFIVNNTRETPERGPYPPTYNSENHSQPSSTVDPKLGYTKETSDSSK